MKPKPSKFEKKIIIKRIQKKKKKVTTQEKILAGLGMGTSLMGTGASMAKPQATPATNIVSSQAPGKDAKKETTSDKIQNLIQKIFGIQKAKAEYSASGSGGWGDSRMGSNMDPFGDSNPDWGGNNDTSQTSWDNTSQDSSSQTSQGDQTTGGDVWTTDETGQDVNIGSGSGSGGAGDTGTSGNQVGDPGTTTDGQSGTWQQDETGAWSVVANPPATSNTDPGGQTSTTDGQSAVDETDKVAAAQQQQAADDAAKAAAEKVAQDAQALADQQAADAQAAAAAKAQAEEAAQKAQDAKDAQAVKDAADAAAAAQAESDAETARQAAQDEANAQAEADAAKAAADLVAQQQQANDFVSGVPANISNLTLNSGTSITLPDGQTGTLTNNGDGTFSFVSDQTKDYSEPATLTATDINNLFGVHTQDMSVNVNEIQDQVPTVSSIVADKLNLPDEAKQAPTNITSQSTTPATTQPDQTVIVTTPAPATDNLDNSAETKFVGTYEGALPADQANTLSQENNSIPEAKTDIGNTTLVAPTNAAPSDTPDNLTDAQNLLDNSVLQTATNVNQNAFNLSGQSSDNSDTGQSTLGSIGQKIVNVNNAVSGAETKVVTTVTGTAKTEVQKLGKLMGIGTITGATTNSDGSVTLADGTSQFWPLGNNIYRDAQGQVYTYGKNIFTNTGATYDQLVASSDNAGATLPSGLTALGAVDSATGYGTAYNNKGQVFLVDADGNPIAPTGLSINTANAANNSLDGLSTTPGGLGNAVKTGGAIFGKISNPLGAITGGTSGKSSSDAAPDTQTIYDSKNQPITTATLVPNLGNGANIYQDNNTGDLWVFTPTKGGYGTFTQTDINPTLLDPSTVSNNAPTQTLPHGNTLKALGSFTDSDGNTYYSYYDPGTGKLYTASPDAGQELTDTGLQTNTQKPGSAVTVAPTTFIGKTAQTAGSVATTITNAPSTFISKVTGNSPIIGATTNPDGSVTLADGESQFWPAGKNVYYSANGQVYTYKDNIFTNTGVTLDQLINSSDNTSPGSLPLGLTALGNGTAYNSKGQVFSSADGYSNSIGLTINLANNDPLNGLSATTGIVGSAVKTGGNIFNKITNPLGSITGSKNQKNP